MKLSTSTISPLLIAVAAAQTAEPAQCPMVWDDPRDVYGNPEYRSFDPYFNGTGKILLRSGCTYWRQNYPRDLPDVPAVGCLNENGLVVPVSDENCATFTYIPTTGKLEDYAVEVIRSVKNNYVCGTDYTDANGEYTDNGKWACKEERGSWDGAKINFAKGPAPYYPFDYYPGTISTQIFTWWIQNPPKSVADAQTLQYRVPNNPYFNHTVVPGDGTFPVIMELVLDV